MSRLLTRIPQLCEIAYRVRPGVRPCFRPTAAKLCTPSQEVWIQPWLEKLYKKQDMVPDGYVMICIWDDADFGRRAHGVITVLGAVGVCFMGLMIKERVDTYEPISEETRQKVKENAPWYTLVNVIEHFGVAAVKCVCLITYVPFLMFVLSAIPCRVYFNKKLDMYIAVFIRNALRFTKVTVPTKDITHRWRFSQTEIVRLRGRVAVLRLPQFKSQYDFQRMARLPED